MLFESDTDVPGIPFEFAPRSPGALNRYSADDDSAGRRTINFTTAGLAGGFPELRAHLVAGRPVGARVAPGPVARAHVKGGAFLGDR